MAREQSPMANFHHETDDDDDDDDDTIELSVEERRLLRKVKRAAKPFKSLERTNQRTNERTGYSTNELSSSSSSWRRRRLRCRLHAAPAIPCLSVGRDCDCCATVGRRHQ